MIAKRFVYKLCKFQYLGLVINNLLNQISIQGIRIMILSIACQKGGVAKSTTAIHLAAGLAKAGKKVLIIDLDSQGNTSLIFCPGFEALKPSQTIYNTLKKKKPIIYYSTYLENLFVCPAHFYLSEVDFSIATDVRNRERRIKNQLDKIKHGFDYVIFDCPPTLNWSTINALTASDYVLIPISPGFYEVESVKRMQKMVQLVQEDYNPNLEVLGILFTLRDATNVSVASYSLLKQNYGELVLPIQIPRNVDIKTAISVGKDLFSIDRKAPAARAYEQLIEHLFNVKMQEK